jgi:hypothetical protein
MKDLLLAGTTIPFVGDEFHVPEKRLPSSSFLSAARQIRTAGLKED